MKEKAIEFFRGIGTIILYFIVAIICGIFLEKYYHSSNKLIGTLSQLALYIILLTVMAIVYHKRLINDAKNFKKEYVNVAMKNWIIGLGVMVISNLIITTFVKNIATNEALNRELLLDYPISNIISMIFLAPLIEEITFRASFKNAFQKWYIFALVTALIFGFMHIAKFTLLELLFIIPYGALGFFFAKAFYETDNIYTSYLAHMLHNALCVVLIFIMM